MIALFAASIVLGFTLVVLAAVWRTRRLISKETARKLVHIAHALVVVGWPAYFGYWLVIVGEVLFMGVILIAQEYRLLYDFRQIDRKTWGEFFFPLGIIWLALVNPPVWVFATSLMLLGLGDGLAALVGRNVKSKTYKIFVSTKSVAGTLTFVLVAMAVGLSAVLVSGVALNTNQLIGLLIFIPLVTALAENLAPYGSDNIAILVVSYYSLTYLGIFT